MYRVQCPWRPEESGGSLEMGVTGDSKMPFGDWEMNPGPPKEQHMLLITEVSLCLLFTEKI